MKRIYRITHPPKGAWLLLILAFLFVLPVTAQKQNRPSGLLQYASPAEITPNDGYMVGGELWETIKPANTDDPSGANDALRALDYNHFLFMAAPGNWREPIGMWPGGYELTSHWRNGRRIVFPVFEADSWPNYGPENIIRKDKGDVTEDDRFMFLYFSPNLAGANDPSRNYKSTATFTDEDRVHLVYEAGWPTTAGVDIKMRAHQYSVNEQNLNDFVALEITFTNTGVVDTDGDGTAELTGHAIDALAINFNSLLAAQFVEVSRAGDRGANRFAAGRTMMLANTPDETGAPYNLLLSYANVPPGRSLNRTTPPAGQRLIGVNDAATMRGYTDIWTGITWLGVKQGSLEDNLTSVSPDKQTIFGTHPIGEGPSRGWYTSAFFEPSLTNLGRSDFAFRSAIATWFQDYGKTTGGSKPAELGPNPAFFSGGTADDVTTFVVGNPNARPNGDLKYSSVDVGDAAGMKQPVWEDALNPQASSGNFYGGVGANIEYTFGEENFIGAGPFSLEVGESITVVTVMASGYRFEGLWGAVKAADWAWSKGWDITGDLPVPPVPEMNVVSTSSATANIQWADVSSIDPDVDGYKIWKAAQYQRTRYLDQGMRVLDRYHQQHEVGDRPESLLDPINPYFDAAAEFKGETQGTYQPAEWGPYELIAKIPVSQLSQYQEQSGNYDYAFEDTEAINGFTYWYYVSAYKEGQFTGPQGAVPVGHIESSNINRNGRNSPGAALGSIGLDSQWGGTYPFAPLHPLFPKDGTQGSKNIGAPFTVTPPVVNPDQVAELITVSPNPYKKTGLNDVRNNPASHNINFLNLPANFTMTIVDVAGQIIFQETVENAANGKYSWDMFSKDGVEVASGLYIYHLQYDGGEVTGHFAILR